MNEDVIPGPAEAGPQGRYNVLLALADHIGRGVAIDEMLQTLIDEVSQASHCERATVYLLDRPREELVSRVAHLPELDAIHISLDTGIAGKVARTGEPLVVNDPYSSPDFHRDVDRATGFVTRSIVAAPIIDKDNEIIGVLEVLNKQAEDGSPGKFDDEDLAFITALARQAGVAIVHTSLYSQLSRRFDSSDRIVLSGRFDGLVGESAAMQEVYSLIGRVASTDLTVLIGGESGTGKELVARAIHANSKRRNKPFIAVDCTTLPDALIENELFGHERGAYTGADKRVSGRFEAADGGTIFLDEIGDLAPTVQAKLLRVLQEKTFERLGGNTSVSVDVRVVAATNRDLKKMVADGRFREDLYYRLEGIAVRLPSLAQRGPKDLDLLVDHLLDKQARRFGLKVPGVSREARAVLHRHAWPGNVRELENCMARAAVLCSGEPVLPEHLGLAQHSAHRLHSDDAAPGAVAAPVDPFESLAAQELSLSEVERGYMNAVLSKASGNQSEASRILGIGRTTLWRRLKEQGED